MKILAIETSCDETGISLIEAKGDLNSLEFEITENIIATQIKIHRKYGGVVPGLARREHEKNLPLLFNKIKPEIKNLNQGDIITVTVGPGLDPCLWSGINFTKNIYQEYFSKTKLLGTNHLEGHLYSFLLDDKFKIDENKFKAESLKNLFPAIALVVSGGHTLLILMKSMNKWVKLGETRDDAAGEAFDKVARLLNLPYPGGPEIEKVSSKTNKESKSIPDFPKPMLYSKNYDFSYSGLKTAVLYFLKNHPKARSEEVAYAFQESAFAPLVKKAKEAAKEYGAKSIFLSGGVAANKILQEKLKDVSHKLSAQFYVAPLKYNTDNAVIIALASYINFLQGKEYKIESQPNLSLD
jgi:N6-L-threonylcarbamoyladenine synthase